MTSPETHKGIILIVVGTFWFAVMSAAGHSLSADYHPLQIVFFRNFGTLLITCCFLRSNLKALRASPRKKIFVVRGCVGQFAVWFWFMAVGTATLPEATAISFSTPIFATIAACLLLKEKVPLRRWVGLSVGLVGVLVILQPKSDTWQIGYSYALLASCFWALVTTAIKSLANTESPQVMVFAMMLVMTVFSIPPALLVWHPVTMDTLPLLALLSLATYGWQLCISYAYKHGTVGELQPFEYTRLIFASLIGICVFHEPFRAATMAGAVIVFAGTFIGMKRKPPL